MGGSQSSEPACSIIETNLSSCSVEADDRIPEANIMTFINDAKCKKYFQNFLKSEFADENLKLYDEIESMKSIKSKAVLQKKLKDNYELFIKPGAEFECNIPDSQRKAYFGFVSDSDVGLDQPLLILLEAMEKEVLRILTLGSFPRFLKSPMYQQYVLDYRRDQRSTINRKP